MYRGLFYQQSLQYKELFELVLVKLTMISYYAVLEFSLIFQ